ncbi:MAG: hypothetical protein Q9190_005198 [Brigantiaea leucoxantha]
MGERQKEIYARKLKPEPDEVSKDSSVHQVLHEKGAPDPEEDIDMWAGIRSDWRVVKQTFALQEVPRQALVIGMAGVLPYLATSLTTLGLSWDINHAAPDGTGYIFSGPSAEFLLNIIEPIQIGYGAVIISFLGAIHWGLEWAKYGGEVGYRRYAIGVVAPAVAWPTLLLPIEYALIAQFSAFSFLYYADARSVVHGWSPSWYSTYRFVLTFFVGGSIVLSLIGRGQIADKLSRLPKPMDRRQKLKEVQAQAAAEEELYMRQKAAEAEEEEEDEDEEEDDEDEGSEEDKE